MHIKLPNKLFLLFCLFQFILISCYEQTVDINFGEFGSTIIIEGNLSDQFSGNQIKISRTAQLNSGVLPQPVSQAVVTLFDDSGNMELLSESSAGNYQINQIQGEPGRTYTLTVATEGNEFIAESTMPQPVNFDSVLFLRKYESDFLYSVSLFFTDPPNEETYCLIKFTANNSDYPFFQTLYHDTYTDGDNISLTYSGMYFYPGNYIVIELMSIDKITFEYFSALLEIDEYVDPEMPDFYEIVGYNPRSNVENGALGYFSVHALRRFDYTIQ